MSFHRHVFFRFMSFHCHVINSIWYPFPRLSPISKSFHFLSHVMFTSFRVSSCLLFLCLFLSFLIRFTEPCIVSLCSLSVVTYLLAFTIRLFHPFIHAFMRSVMPLRDCYPSSQTVGRSKSLAAETSCTERGLCPANEAFREEIRSFQ